MAIFLY